MTSFFRRAMVLASGELLLMFAVSGWAWTRIDEHARVPVHWNAVGRADGFGGKDQALFQLPAALAFALVVLAVAARFQRTPDRNSKPAAMTALSVATLLAILHVATVTATVNGSINFYAPIPAGAVATLLVVLGNYLPKTERNWWFGFKTPWTLRDDRVWQLTHRFAGFAIMAIGVVFWGFILAGYLAAGMVVMVIALVATLVIGTAYSYRLSRR